MPLNAVVQFENPVIFVWEGQLFARNSSTLQSSECAQTLGNRNTEIVAAVNHQHRNAPVLHVVDRIKFLV